MKDKKMKLIRYMSFLLLFISHDMHAAAAVTLSDPSPSIATTYHVGTSHTLIYTVTNHVPRARFPITVNGLSTPVTRISVPDDCGNTLPAGPSTCKIGIQIAPAANHTGLSFNQTLSINYQVRAPLTKNIIFSVPTLQTSQYAYLIASQLNADNNVMYQCRLHLDGSFDFCSVTPENTLSHWNPHSTAFATINGTRYAYVTTNDKEFKNIYQCTLKTNGSFSTCSTLLSDNILGNGDVRGITFATINGIQYAYVAVGAGNGFSSNMYQCTLNANGSFTSCHFTPFMDPPKWNPLDVITATVNNIPYAYIVGSDHRIYYCTFNQNGSFGNCAATYPSNIAFMNPKKITMNTVNNTLFAYVVDSSNLYQCTIKMDGRLDTCLDILNEASTIKSTTLSFSISNGTQYSYIADLATGVYQCKINSSGGFYSCKNTPSSEEAPINGRVSDIAFNS
jgi:hypothetical protein